MRKLLYIIRSLGVISFVLGIAGLAGAIEYGTGFGLSIALMAFGMGVIRLLMEVDIIDDTEEIYRIKHPRNK